MSLPSQQDLFKQFDTDNSGSIDINEFCDYLFKYFEVEDQSEKYIKVIISIFVMCDTESVFKKKDQKIDKKEFERIYKALPPKDGRTAKTLVGTFLFNIIDSNNSGKISKKEMVKFTDALKLNKEHSEKFLNELDTNRDGKVDLIEFLTWYDEC